jgi:hypothetical protein
MNPFGVITDSIGEHCTDVSAAVDSKSSSGLLPAEFKCKSHIAINVVWQGSEGVGIRLAQEAGMEGILLHCFD